jgi:hypothetical protein
MKKLFFIAVMASVAFASCTKNEPATTSAEQQISFASPVVSLNTKAATEVWNNYPTTNDFAVWAHYYSDEYDNFENGKLYMNNVKVTHSGATWKPAKAYYWPKNGSLTFIAYAPSSVGASVGASGIKIASYTVSNDVSKQVDLLFSERAYNKQALDDTATGGTTTGANASDTADPYTGVHISFKHALSSILFTAKLSQAYSGTTITLKKIELTGINSVGTFDQKLEDNGTAATDRDEDLWTGEKTAITYTVSTTGTLSTTAYYTCNNTTTAPQVTSGKRTTDFILLPQTIANNAKLKVTYTIKSGDSEEIVQVLETNLKSSVTEWKWGYRYIYNIIVGLNEISFEPYVADWADANPNAGDVTIQ